MKSSAKRGSRTSAAEVANVSPQGFWLWLDARELFVAFRENPWSADASTRALTTVEGPSAHHLSWPLLDVDLAVESIEAPERFPLVSRAPEAAARVSSARARTEPKRGGRP